MKKLLILFICSLSLGQITSQPLLRENLVTHVYTLADDSMMGRRAGGVHSRLTAEYLADQFREIGIEPLLDSGYFQEFNAEFFGKKISTLYRNVIGIIPAAEHSDEYIVLGAHYDHIGYKKMGAQTIIYNGADDNASGTAVLIETGRLLMQNREQLNKNIILVGFDAEELGLIGSDYFVKNPIIPLEQIALMMSIDMVGWYKGKEITYFGTDSFSSSRMSIDDPSLVPAALNVVLKKHETSLFSATDTEPFAKQGVPTLHATTGTDSPYHKPEDMAELIDYDGMVLITHHIAAFTQMLASDPAMESTGKASFKHKNYDRRFEGGLTLAAGTGSLHYSRGSYRGKTAASLGAGLYGQFNMGCIALRPGVSYELNHMPYEPGKIKTNSMVVPLDLLIQSPRKYVGGGFLSVGGYYRYIFRGTQGGEKEVFKSHFYTNEGGLQWGFGFWLYRVTLGVNFRYALTDLHRTDRQLTLYDSQKIRTRSTQFTVSYRF